MARAPLTKVLLGSLAVAGCLTVAPSSPTATDGTATSDPTTAASSTHGATASSLTATTTGTNTSTNTSAGTSTSTSTSDGSTTSCTFLQCSDYSHDNDFECDINLQDCPEGEKCNMWANDGGSSWNATRCVPVVLNPDGIGESCTVLQSGVSGIDTCIEGAVCWDVDTESGEGTCVAFCTGNWQDGFACPEGYYCGGSRWITLCERICDPLAQDCPEYDLCVPIDGTPKCTLDASGDAGAYGDPCEYINTCDPGLLCVHAEHVPKCEAASCCSPMCDTSKANTCPSDDQVCLPWWEEGMAPQGYETLGVCGIPE